MNMFHMMIVAVTVCLCHGFGGFQNPNPITIPTTTPSTNTNTGICPATTVTPATYDNVFPGNIMLLYNISTLGPNVLNCFYFVFGSLPSATSHSTSLSVLFNINGQQFNRTAVVVLTDGPLIDVYIDNGETRTFSGTKSRNGVITFIDCLQNGVVYLVGCDLSNCGSAVKRSAQNVAQQLANSLNLSPLQSFVVNQTACHNVP